MIQAYALVTSCNGGELSGWRIVIVASCKVASCQSGELSGWRVEKWRVVRWRAIWWRVVRWRVVWASLRGPIQELELWTNPAALYSTASKLESRWQTLILHCNDELCLDCAKLQSLQKTGLKLSVLDFFYGKFLCVGRMECWLVSSINEHQYSLFSTQKTRGNSPWYPKVSLVKRNAIDVVHNMM
jgi:hypothetical protein